MQSVIDNLAGIVAGIYCTGMIPAFVAGIVAVCAAVAIYNRSPLLQSLHFRLQWGWTMFRNRGLRRYYEHYNRIAHAKTDWHNVTSQLRDNRIRRERRQGSVQHTCHNFDCTVADRCMDCRARQEAFLYGIGYDQP